MKNTIKMLMTSTVILGGFGSTVAIADQATELNSSSSIMFEALINAEGTKPVDPTDPEQELPEGGGENGEKPGEENTASGPLRIDYASNFNFGKQKISSKQETYLSNLSIKNQEQNYLPNFVQVTDNRGLHDGWKLSVVASELKDEKGHSLKGSIIDLSNISANHSVFKNDLTIDKSNEVSLDGKTPTVIVEDAHGSGTNNHGEGTWAIAFGEKATESQDDDVTLTVPKEVGVLANASTNYQSVLTWSVEPATVSNTKAMLPSI